MKAASDALIAHLAAVRRGDQPLLMADCFTFDLLGGVTLRYTTADIPILLSGQTFQANSVLVSGLLYKASIGLSVDQQQIQIDADEDDTILGGVPFMRALMLGMFDGASLQRERAFLSSWDDPAVGSVILFKGLIATVDEVGMATAKLTVNSDLTYLDIDLPRNLYRATCLHTVYDVGCGLDRNLFTATGQAEMGSTRLQIIWSGALADYQQGRVIMMNGTSAGASASIRKVSGLTMILAAPLPAAPAVGDVFQVFKGCDHTKAICASRFNNLANFRGFPFVPQPQMVI